MAGYFKTFQWHIVDIDPNLKKCFERLPRLVVYKRPLNLCNILIRADLTPASFSAILDVVG